MDKSVIGIDLGATSIRGAVFENGVLGEIVSAKTPSQGSVEDVLEAIYSLIDQIKDSAVVAIGIGVPSVVDVEKGIVYDVQHIASWTEVPLKQILETRYKIPVLVNNDANCFAVGEYFFGKGNGVNSMIGLTIGTGLGAGVIIHNKLYNGFNCGAGEFGSVEYLDANLEYYASGSFFQNIHHRPGTRIFEQAQNGDIEALAIYQEFGQHVGHAIKTIMYAYDPQRIILGGSVSQAFPLFKENMYKALASFDYPKSVERIKIDISDLKNSGVLGAAALYYNEQ